MYQQVVEIRNLSGLHARPAAALAAEAKKYRSKINIAKGEELVNGKSAMMLLTLGAACGEKLLISAQGEDEQQAVESLSALVQGKFGEV